jgi:hypothetical protein
VITSFHLWETLVKRLLLALSLIAATSPALPAQSVVVSGSGNLTSSSTALPGFTPGVLNYSILLPTSPSPVSVSPVTWTFSNAIATFTQGATVLQFTASFVGYSSAGGGGFNVSHSFDSLLDLAGPQIFTGSISSPTLVSGAFTGISTVFGRIQSTQFTIGSPTVVPEPSTLAMLTIGCVVLCVATLARRVHRG